MAGLPKLSPNPPKEGDSLQTVAEPVAEAEAKPKRTRRPRNTVSLDSPGRAPAPVQTVIPPGTIDAAGVITPVVPNVVEVTNVPALPAPPLVIQIPSAAPVPEIKTNDPAITVPEPPAIDAPSAEQLKEYRVRLAKFANEVLPSGNMIPVEGVGGVTMQLRKFAGLQLGESKDVMRFSVTQWQELLDFLDQYLAANGAVALVRYIQKSLGISNA
jgi:hypothetical protein